MQGIKERFTSRMFKRLWVPALLSSFGWALSDMADAVVVGQRLGTVGLAAIGLILPVYMINCTIAHALGIGGSVKYSRLLGEGRRDEAVESFNGVFKLAAIFSIATAVLGNIFMVRLLALLGTRPVDGELFIATKQYLRILITETPLFYMSNIFNYYLCNDESQKLAGIGSVTGNIVDITMNIVFVLFLGFGTGGAALSTAIGQIVAIAIYLPGFFKKNHALHFTKSGRITEAFGLMRSGLATSVRYLYQMIFLLICNNMLIRLGGETAVAVFDVIQNTSYLLLYLFEGTCRAMQPILSTYQGEHNAKGKKNVIDLATKWGFAVGGLLIAFVEIWPKGLCMLFGIAGTSSESLAFIALRIYGAAAIFAGLNILICGYYQACENEKPSFILETLRGAVLLIPLTFVCYNFGLTYFWLLFLLTEVGSLAIFALLSLGGRFRRAEISDDRIYQKLLLSNSGDVVDVSRELEEFCEKWDVDIKRSMFVTMTFEEIGMAILNHGFGGRTDGYIQITAIAYEDGLLELHIRDDATSFNPFEMHTEKASAGGSFDMDSMGVLVVKERAKEFFYRRYQGFNTLIIKI